MICFGNFCSSTSQKPIFTAVSKCIAQLISYTSLLELTNCPVDLSMDKPSYPVLNPIFSSESSPLAALAAFIN